MTTRQQVDEFLGLWRIAVVGVSRNPKEFSYTLSGVPAAPIRGRAREPVRRPDRRSGVLRAGPGHRAARHGSAAHDHAARHGAGRSRLRGGRDPARRAPEAGTPSTLAASISRRRRSGATWWRIRARRCWSTTPCRRRLTRSRSARTPRRRDRRRGDQPALSDLPAAVPQVAAEADRQLVDRGAGVPSVRADGGTGADGGSAGGGRRRADRCAGGRCQTRRTMSGDVPTHPWTRPGGLPGSIRRCRRTGRAGPLDAPAARPTGPGSSSSPSSCSSVSAGRSSSRRTLRCSASCPGPRPCPRLRRPPVLPRRAPLQARQPGRRAHPPPVSPGPLRRHRPVRPLGRHPRPSPLLRRPAARCPPGSSPCR